MLLFLFSCKVPFLLSFCSKSLILNAPFLFPCVVPFLLPLYPRSLISNAPFFALNFPFFKVSFEFRVFKFRVKIVASCAMDLKDFPMDTQKCGLSLGSCKCLIAWLFWKIMVSFLLICLDWRKWQFASLSRLRVIIFIKKKKNSQDHN